MRKKLKRALSTILSVMMVAGYSPVTAYADGPGEVELGGGKESISPVVSIDGWTYGEDANAPSVTGNPGEGTVTYQYTGTTNGGEEYDLADVPSQAGSYTVTATVAETDNYLGNTCTDEFTIARAGITPTVTITGWTYGYYDVTSNAPAVTEGNPGSGDVEYTYYMDSECLSVTTNENAGAAEDGAYPNHAGTYFVKATVSQTDNYEGGVATTSFSIARQEVTPVFDAEDPEGSNVTFYPPTVPNGTTPIVSLRDQLGNEIPEGEFEVYVNANTHKVIISDALENGGNYTIATAILPYPNTAGEAVVRMAPIAATLTYNGEAQVLLGTGNFGTAEHGTMAYALGTNETDAPTGEYTQDATSIVGTDAGDYYVWYKAVGDGVDYLDSTPVCLKVTIAKKTLTVTAKPVSITYGEAPHDDGVTFSGFADGDSEDDGESVNVGGLTFAYTYSAGGNVNAPVNATSRNYTIIPSGLTSDNYAIQYVNGVLTVNKKEVSISVITWGKTYDGSATASFMASFVGDNAIIPGDDLRISNGIATFEDANVGNDKEVTFSGFGLAGSSAANYVMADVTASDTADITARDLEISGIAAQEKVYDGTNNAATFDFSNVSFAGIVEGEQLNLEATGAFASVDVGEDVEVTITDVTLVDGTNGLASNYNLISYNTSSSADIVKRPVTVEAYSDSKLYDGTALTNEGYHICYTGDIYKHACGAGDQLAGLTITGSQTVAGSSDNVPSGVVIKNGDEVNVTDNYDITYESGRLTVTQKEVTITADSNSKEYDGTILTENGYTYTDLAEGDYIESVTTTGGQTVAGSSANVPSAAVIKNSSNEDVTESYDITYVNGTLEVTTKALTITADSDTKVYDGTALTNDEYTNTTLATGDHVESVTVTGSRTAVGSSANVPSAAVIRNSNNEDVTSSYDITYTNGTLTVTQKSITITANSETKEYDGTALTNEGYTSTTLATGDHVESVNVTGSQTTVGSSDNVPSGVVIRNSSNEIVTSNYNITYVNGTLEVTKKAITITADSDTKVYDGTALTKATYTSDDLADGDSIDSMSITGSQTVVGSSDNVVSAAVIKNSSNEVVTANYDITYVNGTLEVTPKALTITADSDSKEYDGTALTKNSYTNGDLITGDSIESVTVTGSQIVAGTSNNVPSAAVIKNGDSEDVTSNYSITYVNGTLEITPKDLTITANSDTKVYDGTALTKTGCTSSGLATGDSITSVTNTGSQVVVGSSDNVPGAAVIKNGSNVDVTASYNITFENGTLTVTKRPLTITADSDTKVYDGTALTKDGCTGSGLIDGHSIASATVTGSQTTVGSSGNVASAAVIKNGSNEDVTANYDITYANGTLEVTKRALTITADSATKSYDGTALTKNSYTSEGLAEGDSITSVTITGSQTQKGTSNNVPSAAAIENSAQEDVTANYEITYVNGTLEVTKKTVTITADSATKVYDGSVLTKTTYTSTELYGGDYIEAGSVTCTGGQKNVGSRANVPSGAVIRNSSNEDVTESYEITYVDGTLTVTPKPLTITADDATKTYDGSPLSINSYSDTGLATGDHFEDIVITGSQTVVGTSANVPSGAVIRNTSNQNVTSNYEITYVNGSLTVNKKALTITAGSDSKVYDGTALTKNTFTSQGLVSGDSITSVTITDSRTVYGKTPNVPSNPVIENENHENVTGCYEISLVSGELSVTRRPVTITAGSATRVYNGKALTKKNGYTSEGLAEGDSISSLTFASNRTVVGTSENVPTNVKIKNSANVDVSSSYAVTYVNGTLTVTKKALTITAGSASKVYDGTALTKNAFTSQGLVSGDSITSVTISGSRTVVGTTENKPSNPKIMKGDLDVTGCYEIAYVNGSITIQKKPLTITADSAEKIYDGKALTKNSYINTALAQGDRILHVTITGSQTQKGTCDNEPSAAQIYNGSNKDVSDSYEITYVKGTLTVIGQARVLTAPQAAMPKYNGSALQLLKSAGTAEQGTMQYALGNDDTTVPTTGWKTTTPTAVQAGTYYVWYKAVGNNDYIDSEAACVTVTIIAAISYKVTFKVVNGNWNLGGGADKVVTLSGHEGDSLKLTANQIPGVGTRPNTGFKEGSWDVTPGVNTKITKDITYTYTYEAKTPISAKVTFKVVNGAWGDGNKEDKTYIFNGYEGDVFSLSVNQIPSVGTKPNTNFKAGSWDVKPATGDRITQDITYTYTYEAKTPISAKVTFKVVNGSWDDGTTKDKVVTLKGYEGDILKLSADQIPTVGGKPDSIYKVGNWDVTPNTAYSISKDITYTYTYTPKKTITSKVTFKVLYGSWNDGKTDDVIVTLTGYEGDSLKLSAEQIPAVGSKPIDKYKEGKWNILPSTDTAITRDTTYTYMYVAKQAISYRVTFNIVNGYADDGRTRISVIALNGLEGDTLKLPADQIPSVGNNPLANYKKGSWDVTPVKDTVITKDTTYTYTYVEKDKISATVTFKVVNGSWNDGTSTDKVVTLSGYEGTILKLMNYQIPAVGNKAKDQSFKAGSWDVVPDTTTQFTKNVTYTYTYAAKTPISAKVTYKVVNGSWDDGKSKDVVVTLKGYEGDILRLSADQIPEVGNKPAFAYKAGKWDMVPKAYTNIDKDTTYTYTYAPKKEVKWNITFKVLNGTWNNGSSDDVFVTLKGYEGDTLKLTNDQIPTVGDKPADRYKEGIWNFIPDTETAITRNMTYAYTYKAKNPIASTITFKVVNGTWNDGTNKDITVMLKGLEGDPLQLSADQIPQAGNRPNDLFMAGSWDVIPDTQTSHEGNMVYTYTYAPREAIKVKVTFKVENGTWNDETKDDVVITLEGFKGDEVKLTSDQIPAYGLKPAEGFKPGSWDTLPYIAIALEKDLTFTYSYMDQNVEIPDDDGGVYIVKEKQEKNYGQSALDNTAAEVKKAVLTNEDLVQIYEGNDVNVWIEIKDRTEDVKQDEQELIEGKVKEELGEDYVIACYLNVNLWKQVTGEFPQLVKEVPNGKVKISMILPENLRKEGRTFKVARIHGDAASILDAELEEATNRLAFETDAFSIYALVYYEPKQKEPKKPVTEVFTDIDPKSWYVDAAQYVYDEEIMFGKGDASFAPDAVITREEVVQTLNNHMGQPTVEGENPFSDVVKGAWYFDAVLWGNKNGIAVGFGDGYFGIGKTITREQLAQMLYNYATFNEYDLTLEKDAHKGYSDSKTVSGWAVTAMDWAISQGIMSGKGVTGAPKSEIKLDPLAGATRAECASMIMKIDQKNKK